MEDQNEPAATAPAEESPREVVAAPVTGTTPASPGATERPSPYRSLVAGMLTSAILVSGAMAGSSYYLGDKLEALRAQLADVGGSAPSKQAPADNEEAPPSKVDVSKVVGPADPSRGPADAKVTMVEFSDYQCPFCGRYFEESLPALLAEYKDKVHFVWKDFPLPMHSDAPKAAEAAHCAGEQGKYWEYHDILFRNQRALGQDALKSYAKTLGLDESKFAQCLDSGKFAKKIKDDMNQARGLGVNGTPTLFINGERVVGAQPVEEFKRRIDAALAQ